MDYRPQKVERIDITTSHICIRRKNNTITYCALDDDSGSRSIYGWLSSSSSPRIVATDVLPELRGKRVNVVLINWNEYHLIVRPHHLLYRCVIDDDGHLTIRTSDNVTIRYYDPTTDYRTPLERWRAKFPLHAVVRFHMWHSSDSAGAMRTLLKPFLQSFWTGHFLECDPPIVQVYVPVEQESSFRAWVEYCRTGE